MYARVFMVGLFLLLGSPARAELGPSARLKAVRAMVLIDPMNRIINEVPTFDLMTSVDLEATLRKKTANPFRERTMWFEIGMNYFLRKDYQRAAACVEKSYINNELTRRPYGFQALLLQLEGKWPQATSLWAEVLDQRTQDPDALLGKITFELTHFKFRGADESISTLLKAELDPMVKLHFRGIQHFIRGDFFEAHHFFLKASKLKNAMPQTSYALAVISLHEGQIPTAVGWLRRALEHAVEFDRILYINNPVFDPIREEESFRKLAADYKLELYEGGIPPQVLAQLDTEWTSAYRRRCESPSDRSFKIQLKAFEAKE